jgi:hypothetical protein
MAIGVADVHADINNASIVQQTDFTMYLRIPASMMPSDVRLAQSHFIPAIIQRTISYL